MVILERPENKVHRARPGVLGLLETQVIAVLLGPRVQLVPLDQLVQKGTSEALDP